MKISEIIDPYARQIVECESKYRKAFGAEKLNKERREYRMRYSLRMTWSEFLKKRLRERLGEKS